MYFANHHLCLHAALFQTQALNNKIDIIALLNKYAELYAENARYDLMVAVGQPHDIAASITVENQFKALEAQLLELGMYKWATENAIAKFTRSTK